MIEAIDNQLPLNFEVRHIRPTACAATVIVPAKWVSILYQCALRGQQQSVQAYGFQQGSVPLEYIHANFRSTLLEHVKEFFFNYCVISFLYQQLRENRIVFSGEPRIADIRIQHDSDASFTFEINTFTPIEIRDWKYLPFKAPKRKKYKDLDRQVENFIKEEKSLLKETAAEIIAVGDWVNFTISLTDEHGATYLDNYAENLWFKLGTEEVDKSLSELFIGKKVGDIFCTNNKDIQAYFSECTNIDHYFLIHIIDMQPYTFFCLDQFKRNFKLKTNKEINRKLIEVFSYRNDLSQRRSMAEESLKLLLSKNHFVVPNHFTLRQQDRILYALQSNPDYQVYRTQKDFKRRIEQLAQRQTKECLLLDLITHFENIVVTNEDIKHYLNLIKRPRTKEFIYFDSIPTKIKGQEVPIPAEELKLACLREKTLNHIIYHLTKE
ncbi:MAG TPA: trigger factor [Candidatus Babeliales bacterium]|nr:trigger factor [Candidatus Babeliales bacterium]